MTSDAFLFSHESFLRLSLNPFLIQRCGLRPWTLGAKVFYLIIRDGKKLIAPPPPGSHKWCVLCELNMFADRLVVSAINPQEVVMIYQAMLPAAG